MNLRWMRVACALLIAACGMIQTSFSQPVGAADEPEFAPGELIIKFKANANDDELLDAVKQGGLKLERVIPILQPDHPGLNVARTHMAVPAAIQMLEKHPAVEYVQPNWIYRHQAVATDSFYSSGQLWGMYGNASSPANQFGSQAAEAWALDHTGFNTGVYVAVLDEGIQVTHPDLAANIWKNPGEIAGNGIDDDSNGLIDDVNGWDFYHNNNSVFDGGDADGCGDGHGTHVAGTIGAAANNGGVVGVNWNVKIIPAKFLGPQGGSTTAAIAAINYLIGLKVNKGINLVAINASWGGGGFDPSLLAAITAAADQKILFVAAAGNGDFLGRAVNTDLTPFYPAGYNTSSGAGYDSVIAVTAINSTGSKPSWANYGATTVDLGAPGVSIISTYPSNAYASANGTSMATPHVTGAVALYASVYPAATPAQIKQAILDAATATPTSSMTSRTTTGGRLNIGGDMIVKAPSAAVTPAAPSDLTATAVSRSQINLTWTHLSGNVNGFKIERSTGAGSTSFTQIATLGPSARSFSSTGLSRNTTYNYRVRAYNSVGDSGYSTTATATTRSR